MANFIVAYDLRKSGQDYSGLIKAIKSYPYIREMQSTWFIKSSGTSSAIYDKLSAHIDENDSLFICRIPADYMGWLHPDTVKFLST